MAVVTNVSSLDLRFYAQYAGIALANLGNTVANDFYYGRKCAEANLRRLKLAEGYMNILENYLPEGYEVSAQRTITYLSGTTGAVGLNVSNGSVDTIAAQYNLSLYQTALDLQTLLNSLNFAVKITSVIALGDLTVATTPVQITFTAVSGMGVSGNNVKVELFDEMGDNIFDIVGYTYLQGGQNVIVSGDNCVTEDQLQNVVLPNLGGYLNIVFPQPGLTVSSQQENISILLQENGSAILQEDGNFILL